VQSFRVNAASEAEATGHVRLATAENLANQFIIPSLPELLKAHPGLSVEVLTDIATSNLHRRDADLALRMVRPERGNLTVRQIGILGYGLYGSQTDPQANTGSPPNPISGNRYIGWSERQQMLPAAQWMERQLKGDAPAIITTSLLGQVAAVKAGLGHAILPHFLADEAGLEAVTKDVGLDQPIWLVVHSDLAASSRVKVVADHVVAVINRHSDQLLGLTKIAP